MTDDPTIPEPTRNSARRRARRRRHVRLALLLLGLPLLLVVLFLAAWALDVRASDGEALRNVEVGGRAVGGLDRSGVEAVVATVSDRYAEGAVEVRTSAGTLEATAEELSLTVDHEATVEAALDEGRDEPLLRRPLEWAASLFSPRSAPVLVVVDEVRVASIVAERDPTSRMEPVEPSLATADGTIRVVPGRTGRGLDGARIAERIPAVAASGDLPVVVEAAPDVIQPRFDEADAERLVDRAAELTAEALLVEAAGVQAAVPPEMQRAWLESRVAASGLALTIDTEAVQTDLVALLPDAGQPAVDAGLVVESGGVVVVPGQDGTACCDARAASSVFDAMANRAAGGGALVLPLTVRPPERTTEEVAALGVVQPVASFTTNHAAGESRVINIQLMADLVRGVIIEPGGSFSVNDHVGERTVEKGFAEGGFIEDGVLTTAIGGGVSQFATTLFNAAFFAGIEIDDYQSHSLYISRYPYGREATLSFPAPDLVITNPTPYGILVWPTYTASSITVTLYSTPWATAAQTGQSQAPAGNCTRVTTERTRTFLADGHQEVDQVYATYRPAEGVDC